MTTYSFTIYVEPKAKKRPKVYRWSTVNPSREDEELAMRAFRSLDGIPDTPLGGQVRVQLKFYKNPPKNTPNWKLPWMDKGLIRPNKSPDLDNYVKLILDALNGGLWEDDRFIVEMHSSKYYTLDKARIEIVADQLSFPEKKADVESVYKNFRDESLGMFFETSVD